MMRSTPNHSGKPGQAHLRSHGLTSDATVVDLDAGTGRFALAAAQVARRVIAVDVSPAMLQHLREKARSQGVSVETVQAGFLSYQHTGDAADLVYSRHALHQLPDFFKAIALQRIHDMLRPHGIFRLRDLILDCDPAEVPAAVEQWLDRAHDDPETGYTANDIAEHFRTEFSTYRWLIEPMLEHTGFEILDVEYSLGSFGAYTCRRR